MRLYRFCREITLQRFPISRENYFVVWENSLKYQLARNHSQETLRALFKGVQYSTSACSPIHFVWRGHGLYE